MDWKYVNFEYEQNDILFYYIIFDSMHGWCRIQEHILWEKIYINNNYVVFDLFYR